MNWITSHYVSHRLHSALVLCALALPSCQAQQLSVGGQPDPLESEDVNDLPEGEGFAQDVSGAYLFSGVAITDCGCREGSATEFGCGLDWDLQVDGLWLQQTQGRLQATAIVNGGLESRSVFSGSLDQDGSLVLGGQIEVSGGMRQGQSYILMTGMVVAQDTVQTHYSARTQYVQGADSFDCDLEVNLELLWSVNGQTGDVCVFDNDCPGGTCVDRTCSSGEVGAPCDFPADCASRLCGPADLCLPPGGCTVAAECEGDLMCYQGQCQAGEEGDSCDDKLDCSMQGACVGGICYDGSAGDPCGQFSDCESFECTAGSCQ